jgi:hypothetical protein
MNLSQMGGKIKNFGMTSKHYCSQSFKKTPQNLRLFHTAVFGSESLPCDLL